MKNNKGFTLIEVLAVVAILITIIMIIAPKIFKQFKTAENVTDKEQINAIINTSKIYMNQNSNLLPQENDLYVIELQELKDSGLIKTSQILNPSTKQELTGCVVVSYENNKYKYEYKEDNCDKTVLVTFDPQGGQLNQTTKVVSTTDTYGELPTPTKEGYTFLGWNGKNMFNYDSDSVLGNSTSKINLNGEKIYKRQASYRPSVSIWPVFYTSTEYIDFTENNEYAISFDIWADYEVNFASTRQLFINNSVQPIPTHNLSNIKASKQKLSASFIYKDGTNPILHIYPIVTSQDGINTDNNYYISNVQLEEGDTATEYEPYYITSDTEVVQENNHTLKAIWQANS